MLSVSHRIGHPAAGGLGFRGAYTGCVLVGGPVKKLIMLLILGGVAFAVIKMMNVETQAR